MNTARAILLLPMILSIVCGQPHNGRPNDEETTTEYVDTLNWYVGPKNLIAKIFFSHLTPLECSEYLFYVREKFHIRQLPTLPDDVFNDVLTRLLPKSIYFRYLKQLNKSKVSKVDWELMSQEIKEETYNVLMREYHDKLNDFIEVLDAKLHEYNITSPYEQV